MTNPLPLAPSYGPGPYSVTLHSVLADWGTPGYSVVHDVLLTQFPLDEGGAPDTAAIQTYIEEMYAANNGFTFQLRVHYDGQPQGSDTYPDVVGTVDGIIDGIDAINGYLGTDITLTP